LTTSYCDNRMLGTNLADLLLILIPPYAYLSAAS
jgi:hypothetical protein